MSAPRLNKVELEFSRGRFRLVKVRQFNVDKTRTYFVLRDVVANIETLSEDDLKSLIELCTGVLKDG